MKVREEGCCAIYESCSDFIDLFIGVLVVIGVTMIALAAYCICRYRKEQWLRKQHEKEAVGIDDLSTKDIGQPID